MPTLEQLKRTLAAEKKRLERLKEEQNTKAEKKRIQKEINLLKNPNKRKAIEIAKRTGRGLGLMSKYVYNKAKAYAEYRSENDNKANPKTYTPKSTRRVRARTKSVYRSAPKKRRAKPSTRKTMRKVARSRPGYGLAEFSL